MSKAQAPSWDNYLRAVFLEKALSHRPGRLPRVVLDIGSGPSSFSREVFAAVPSFIPADISLNSGIRVRCSMTDLPFRSEIFDLVISLRALQHVVRETDALREVLRVTHRRGRVILGVANRHSWTLSGGRLQNPRWRRKIPYREYRLYSRRELETKLLAMGCTEVRIWCAFFLPEAINRLPASLTRLILRLGILLDRFASHVPLLRSVGTHWIGFGVKS